MEKTEKRHTSTIVRFAIIFFLIALGFGAVLAKIIYTQYFNKDYWEAVEKQQDAKIEDYPATRGNILDCNGHLLAGSISKYNIYMDTQTESLKRRDGKLFYRHLDTLAIDLSSAIGDRSAEEYRRYIENGYLHKNRWLRLTQTSITLPQLRQLKTNQLIRLPQTKSGIIIQSEPHRIRPYGSIACRTIGNIYGNNGHGRLGLEQTFDTELAGQPGVCRTEDICGEKRRFVMQDAVTGKDLVTTIDVYLQDIVESELRKKLELFQSDWGCCILMESATGEIKAISNLDRCNDGHFYEISDRAVTHVEPGSTFKTISLLVTLNDKKAKITDTYPVSRSVWTYRTLKHSDAHPRDTIYDLRSGLAASSNILFAKMVAEHYGEDNQRFVDLIRQTGLGDTLFSEIPNAQPAFIEKPKDRATIAKMAYGYHVELSPMQILMFYNAIANNGVMVRPRLIRSIQQDGHIVRSFPTEVVNPSICSPEVLEDVRGALHDVVWDSYLGTASKRWGYAKAQSPLVHIAGKTGTAQTRESGYNGSQHRMTFVGYFPEENPQYTCICMLNGYHQLASVGGTTRKPDAGIDCGEVVRIIAEKTMAYEGCYIYLNGVKTLQKRTKK